MSKGYGFVAFTIEADASQAIYEMNGATIEKSVRSIRCNWATYKGSEPKSRSKLTAGHRIQLQDVLNASGIGNTTVYVTNMVVIDVDCLFRLFHVFGVVCDIRPQVHKGYAFVSMETHEAAAAAIFGLNGTRLSGRPLKVVMTNSSALGDHSVQCIHHSISSMQISLEIATILSGHRLSTFRNLAMCLSSSHSLPINMTCPMTVNSIKQS